jgi:hypothetical protein
MFKETKVVKADRGNDMSYCIEKSSFSIPAWPMQIRSQIKQTKTNTTRIMTAQSTAFQDAELKPSTAYTAKTTRVFSLISRPTKSFT